MESALVIVTALALVGGCGGASNGRALDAGVEARRDSASSSDGTIDASAESDLGARPMDLAGASPETDRRESGGERLYPDALSSDRQGLDALTDAGDARADSPMAEDDAAAAKLDGGLGTDGGGDGEAWDAGPKGRGVDAGPPTVDVSAPDAADRDAGIDGSPAPAALDAGVTAVDSGAADAGRPDGPLPRTWVYVMAGQSNMLGQAYVADLSAADAQPVPNAEIYFVSPLQTNSHLKAWLPVAPGLGWHDDNFGPELGFARQYHGLYPDRHLALIKVSQGATALFDVWKAPTGSLYQLLTKTVREQMQVLSTRGRPEIAGFLWLQGESDGMVLEQANLYRDNLLTMLGQLRVDLALATMPVVAGLIATDCCWPYADTIRKSTTQVSTMVGNMKVVETDDLPMSTIAVGHYSAQGQLELGSRFANAATALIGTRWKFPDRLSALQGDSFFSYRERSGSDTSPMVFDAAQQTWKGASGTSIAKGGMTPGATQQAELAWSAPFAGTFQIAVSVAVSDPASSGAKIEISDGQRTVWGPWSIGSGSIVTSFPRDMEQNDPLYFRTSAGASSNPSRSPTPWQIDINTIAVSTSWTAPALP